jgi:NAD(P)-dependent dehydrogenase (short-subunit alcohol dehydrogenase family)
METPQRVALVSGSNRGIGREIARQLAELGHTVLLSARSKDTAGAAAGRLAPALRAPLPGEIGWVVLPTLAAIALGLTAPMGRAAFLAGLAVAVAGLLAYIVSLRHRPALLVAGFLVWL